MLRSLSVVCALAAALPVAECVGQGRRPVRVFILAGQSNMEGKAQNRLLDHQAQDPATAAHYAHWRSGDKWVERDDVWIKFWDRKGPLTIGYGSKNRTGVELEFGHVMGERFKEPVLLIKTAWGGKSIYRDFRPPSAGLPSEEALAAELEQARKRTERRNEKQNRSDAPPTLEQITDAYGKCYRDMIAEVRDVQANYRKQFPELERSRFELAGFVWFQGWNDQYDEFERDYEANLRHLIADVRRDLEAPDLPVVVGVMGQNGSQPAKGAMLAIQNAQLAVADMDGVHAVRTDELVDVAAEALYPTWKENKEAWEQTGSDHPYHYLGSGIWHLRMGRAFADSMLELIEE